jgi:hypothetical protein
MTTMGILGKLVKTVVEAPFIVVEEVLDVPGKVLDGLEDGMDRLAGNHPKNK